VEPTALQLFLTDIGSVITSVIGWGGNIAAFVISKPVLTAYVGMGLFGMAVILFKSFVHR
jgi:galactitol-specific phosphotransferase system IIC component